MHTEASFSPNSIDLLCLRVAQTPPSRDMVIFVLTTTTTTTTQLITLPLAHARRVIIICLTCWSRSCRAGSSWCSIVLVRSNFRIPKLSLRIWLNHWIPDLRVGRRVYQGVLKHFIRLSIVLWSAIPLPSNVNPIIHGVLGSTLVWLGTHGSLYTCTIQY